MEGSDACFAPVLSISEAPEHPHNAARDTFVEARRRTAAASRSALLRTTAAVQRPASKPAANTDAVLAQWGFSHAEISRLRDEKAIF